MTKLMKLCITGSRDFDDQNFILNTLYEYCWDEGFEFDEILVGDCPSGVDKQVADLFKDDKKVIVKIFKANWKVGPKAGPLRNQEMINADPYLVLAFMAKGSKGTKDCVSRALKAGKPVLIIPVETKGNKNV